MANIKHTSKQVIMGKFLEVDITHMYMLWIDYISDLNQELK